MRKSQDLLGTSIEGYLAIARSDLASEVENRQLRRLSFQLSEILSLSSRSISRSSSRSVPVTNTIIVMYLFEKRQNYYSFDQEHHATFFLLRWEFQRIYFNAKLENILIAIFSQSILI